MKTISYISWSLYILEIRSNASKRIFLTFPGHFYIICPCFENFGIFGWIESAQDFRIFLRRQVAGKKSLIENVVVIFQSYSQSYHQKECVTIGKGICASIYQVITCTISFSTKKINFCISEQIDITLCWGPCLINFTCLQFGFITATWS